MSKANLKSYAPKARLDFIKAVTERANVLGISAAGVVPAEVRGDVALIDGREWPAKLAGQRDELIARIKRHGFEQTMDEVAYTWFNRFAALRYMEIHDYLGHGWRVLSTRDGGLPEILRHACEVTLPGLNPDRAREMQLAGNQDNELYKLLLVAQCNELSRVMPFLFERIDDETELLLPENLLRTDSIVAKLVEQVPEEDWKEIEVVGWLYQFYISEKKDQVIRKVVKSEDIPAATQLFTPNWIVQYLVQNSVGRLWTLANPNSTLASQWAYFVPLAQQPEGSRAELEALFHARVDSDGEALNPETITILDPACGSGHILVVAYDVLKAIYLERGYQLRAIPRLILERNLHGLDIDSRAAQLAAFALLMRARVDDRRILLDPPKINVLALQDSVGLDADEMGVHLSLFGLERTSIAALLEIFRLAKTFGALIDIPVGLAGELASMAAGLQRARADGDLYAQRAAMDLSPLVMQASLLARRYDAVIANPPYMGSKGQNETLRNYAAKNFPTSKSNLFSMFIERGFGWCKPSSFHCMVTLQDWLFSSTFEDLRLDVLRRHSLSTLVHIGYNSFPEMNSKVVKAAATSILATRLGGFVGKFVDLNSAPQSADKNEVFLGRDADTDYSVSQVVISTLPGSPISYWVNDAQRMSFENGRPISEVARFKAGISTGDNKKFQRYWHEIDRSKARLSLGEQVASPDGKWFPCNSGAPFRKWYGFNELVIDWEDNGARIRSHTGSAVRNEDTFFRSGLTYTKISTGKFSARYKEDGFLYDDTGRSVFCRSDQETLFVLGLLCSEVANSFLSLLAPGMSFTSIELGRIPLIEVDKDSIAKNAERLVAIAKEDWDSTEESWNFVRLNLISTGARTLAESWRLCSEKASSALAEAAKLEFWNNSCLTAAYGFNSEGLTSLGEPEITLYRADREADSQRLVSYIVGCVMGRYSLDEPGLLYALAGNRGFDSTRCENRFPADSDGILPLTDERWFDDDAANRVSEFLVAAWGIETREENMTWLAASLGAKGSETPDEAVRRYLADKFFKDHLQTYKKRPIYWLFSSGKQGAFQALVYLHRYSEGTLGRMRAEYVVPLIAKMVSRLDMLDKDVAAASSAAARTKLQKQVEVLRKQQLELLAYDEKVRHYADMRITLDLDDGVKVNYAKFGDLVAESKAITGGSDE